MRETPPKGPIVLFDGECRLCCGAVQWLQGKSPPGLFECVPLASDTAIFILDSVGGLSPALESLVLIENGKAFTEMEAVARIAGRLAWPWRLGKALLWIPRPLANAVYRVIARYRYRMFGRIKPSSRIGVNQTEPVDRTPPPERASRR